MLYLCRETYNQFLPDLLKAEWDKWLDDNCDPGHYDADKDRRYYPPLWETETFCPQHLENEVRRICEYYPEKSDVGRFVMGRGYSFSEGTHA